MHATGRPYIGLLTNRNCSHNTVKWKNSRKDNRLHDLNYLSKIVLSLTVCSECPGAEPGSSGRSLRTVSFTQT